jgi:uncharacterized cupin superfamily protein
MSMRERPVMQATVVKAGTASPWGEVERPAGDTNPPGYETIVFRSADGAFSCGFWKRVPESGSLSPPFHEIMCFLEGAVRVTRADGTVLDAGPGDVLSAPHGSSSGWRSTAPVLKFWAVYHGEAGDARVTVTRADGEVPWSVSDAPADDGHAPGREIVAFAAGPFAAGLWERDRIDRDFARDVDEVALILSGEADITTEGGVALHAGPGDVFVTPRGSRGHWRTTSPLRKFWATYEG